MKNDLVLNLIPIELANHEVTIYTSDTTPDNPEGVYKSIFAEFRKDRPPEQDDDKVIWDVNHFNGATELVIQKPSSSALKRILSRHLKNYFYEKNLIVGHDFVGSVKVLVPQQSSRHPSVVSYKEFSIRVMSPHDQYICQGNQWCLNLTYLGITEAASEPLRQFSGHEDLISKAISSGIVKRISDLTDAEKDSDETFPIVSKKFGSVLGIRQNLYKPPNKYLNQYVEIESFYNEHLMGQNISDELSIFESGFQPIPDSQLFSASRDSNLLVFGENNTNVSPYNGLKAHGPYRAVEDNNYRVIFIFHEADKDYANNLYGYLKKGLKGFPGLFRFVGLDINLDRDKTITFTQEDPAPEVYDKLDQISFDPNLRYLAIYISRFSKDEVDETRRSYYFKLKQVLLAKNISSQVIYKMNIDKPVFNYHLPNISIAMLAKLGGVPWRLSRPIKNDLIIGVGAFRQEHNIYLGTTVAFKNDGSFVRFDSRKTNSSTQLADYFHEIISTIAKDQPDIKRVVIHYYKSMNQREEKVIRDTLDRLGLKIPYVVLTIIEDRDGSLTPFDMSYSGKMPVSGTCVILRRGTYLLCNNTRYSDLTGQKIDDFPFPVQLKISKSAGELGKEDVQELIDQVYQFSRMYWVSVKQRGRPVTVEYSERIAKLSSYFGDENLPNTDTANRTLWFL